MVIVPSFEQLDPLVEILVGALGLVCAQHAEGFVAPQLPAGDVQLGAAQVFSFPHVHV